MRCQDGLDWFVPGVAHHVTQRGNNRQQVFISSADYEVYLDRLFSSCGEYRARVLAYCLMPNHVHVVVVPEASRSLAKVFGRLQADYARYVNVKRGAIGHLWQERFYSHAMDERHAICAISYVERNPLRAGLVENAAEYEWSSAAAHVRGSDETGRIEMEFWSRWYTAERWQEVLTVGMREEALRARFREATLRGLPMGDSAWVRGLEREFGRDLSYRHPGRQTLWESEEARLVAVG